MGPDEIQVRVLDGRRVDNISVETAGDRMTVRTLPAGVVGINGPQARYEVSVPRSLARIEVQTSNGRIQVVNCNGTVDRRDVERSLAAHGNADHRAPLDLERRIDAEIRALDTDARVTTSNGAIRLALAPTMSAQIEARTSNGQVTVTGLPLTTTTSGPTELRGTLGAGGQRLRGRDVERRHHPRPALIPPVLHQGLEGGGDRSPLTSWVYSRLRALHLLYRLQHTLQYSWIPSERPRIRKIRSFLYFYGFTIQQIRKTERSGEPSLRTVSCRLWSILLYTL